MSSSFLTMSQFKTGASRICGRLFSRAASTAFVLSALTAGVSLSSGDAKACNLNLLTPGQTDSCSYTDTLLGIKSIDFTDTITLITPSSITDTHVNLELTGLLYPNAQKQVDIDYNPSPLTGANDTVIYRLDKTGVFTGTTTPAKVWFDRASLSFALGGTGASVTKEIFSDATLTNLIATLNNSTGSTIYQALPGMFSTIWVRDTMTPGAGSIDNVVNDFRNVPGPLPILGAGAAFGFSRKLRGRIKLSQSV
jgi:hypothetical protein